MEAMPVCLPTSFISGTTQTMGRENRGTYQADVRVHQFLIQRLSTASAMFTSLGVYKEETVNYGLSNEYYGPLMAVEF
jgi:hypothetical protein